MPSAAARPAGVRCRSRPSAWATSPSATSRRNISLAACVVTPRWRAIWAAVTRPASSDPTRTRRARRYSWAAADRSRWSWRRGMRSGYGTCPRPERADPADDRDRQTGQPGEQQDRPSDGPARVAVGGARRSPTGRGAATTAAASSDQGRHRRDRGERPGWRAGPRGRGPGGRGRTARPMLVAGRGEPAAAGHLADQPADPERDRQPADEGPAEAAARSHRNARRSAHAPMSADGAPEVGRWRCVGPLACRGGSPACAASASRGGAPGPGRRRSPSSRHPARRSRRPSSPTRTSVVWVGSAGRPARGPVSPARGPVVASASGAVRVRAGAAAACPGRAPGPCLVLRSVLARVGVFLRVERPVRAAGRAVPAGAAPVGLERVGVGAVVGGRTERAPCSRRAASAPGARRARRPRVGASARRCAGVRRRPDGPAALPWPAAGRRDHPTGRPVPGEPRLRPRRRRPAARAGRRPGAAPGAARRHAPPAVVGAAREPDPRTPGASHRPAGSASHGRRGAGGRRATPGRPARSASCS